MQRRLRITLTIVAATGALALGAGTAAADPISDLLGGANSNSSSSDNHGDKSDADNNGNSHGQDGEDGQDGTEGGADGRDGADDTNTSIAPSSGGHSDKAGKDDDSGSDN